MQEEANNALYKHIQPRWMMSSFIRPTGQAFPKHKQSNKMCAVHWNLVKYAAYTYMYMYITTYSVYGQYHNRLTICAKLLLPSSSSECWNGACSLCTMMLNLDPAELLTDTSINSSLSTLDAGNCTKSESTTNYRTLVKHIKLTAAINICAKNWSFFKRVGISENCCPTWVLVWLKVPTITPLQK